MAPVARALTTADAFGRLDTHLEVYDDYDGQVAPIPDEGPSRSLIEMTLVDNHTGETLWHARQWFDVNPESPTTSPR